MSQTMQVYVCRRGSECLIELRGWRLGPTRWLHKAGVTTIRTWRRIGASVRRSSEERSPQDRCRRKQLRDRFADLWIRSLARMLTVSSISVGLLALRFESGVGAGAGSVQNVVTFGVSKLFSRCECRSPRTLTRRTPPASTCSTSALLRRTCLSCCCRRLALGCQELTGRNTGRRMPSRRRQLRLQAVLLPRHRQLLLGRIQANPFKAPTKAEDVGFRKEACQASWRCKSQPSSIQPNSACGVCSLW